MSSEENLNGEEMTEEDRIQEQLDSLREGYNDQRIFDAGAYTESINIIDETHGEIDEWFLIFDEDQPVLRCTHAKWNVENNEDEWEIGDWEPDEDIFGVDVTKEAIPWELLDKETSITPEDWIWRIGEKFVDKFGDLFFKGEDGKADPNVVVDPILRKELESYCDVA
jgi:hypothetical protein